MRAWRSLLIQSWHRRLRAEARRLVHALDVLHPLLLTLKRFVANLIAIPTGAFIAFAFAFPLSLLAAPTSLLIPTSLGLVLAKPFSLESLSPFPLALVVFAFAFFLFWGQFGDMWPVWLQL